jgi:mitochondrial fission protein ELM1
MPTDNETVSPPRSETELSCWVLTDGKAGTENQCIGLAEAVGLDFSVKRIVPRYLWRHLPTRWWTWMVGTNPNKSLAHDSDTLTPPWPDLLIASGRTSVAYAVAIKRASRGHTFAVQIQNPRIPAHHFDLVIPPRHDHLNAVNVISTMGALNRITPQRLKEGAEQFSGLLADLPRPLIAVLIGGSNRAYAMTAADTGALIEGLTKLVEDEGAGLAVTTSRRTGPENASRLRDGLARLAAVLSDGSGENPYFGFLALADAIVVTADSVSMTSEACSTGKPVYVAPLSGGSAKFREFHRTLMQAGYTQPFEGSLSGRTNKRLDETATIAAEVRRRLGLSNA